MLSLSVSYEFYSSFAIWPDEVRSDLRAGVKAKQQGNFALSRRLLTQCVVYIVGVHMVSDAPQEHLKLRYRFHQTSFPHCLT
jgi:hypothetical protein